MPGETLRLVLFGMPGVGKSSLLGALAQAAQTQEPLLHGRLQDPTGCLEELRRRLYEGQPSPTLDEIAAFPITYEPLLEGDKVGPPLAVVLFDCDGRVALDFLGGQQTLESGQRLGELARAIRKADALILVVDAAVEPAQLGHDLARGADFLHGFEKHRSRLSEVSGLPVFLVLSKCDLLAKATDTFSTWLQRIEEHKRQVAQRFRDYLAQRPDRARSVFGRIDLQVWGTAVRRPALADKPARPSEPYGVAELFRQAFEGACTFRRHYQRAARRLHVTVAGVVGLVLLMAVLAVGLYFAHSSDPLQVLEEEVRATLTKHGDSQDWLHQEPVEQLRKFQDAPDFARLPPTMQAEVKALLRKMEIYKIHDGDYVAGEKQLIAATAMQELDALEKNLQAKPLPPEHADIWKETRLDQRRQQLFDDIIVLRLAVKEEMTWLDEQIAQGQKLGEEWSRLIARAPTDPLRQKWAGAARAFLGRKPPHAPTDRPPGASLVTYATVDQFEGVARKRATWQHVKGQLEKLVQ